jgi:predicted RNase H-like HicB family nuclease
MYQSIVHEADPDETGFWVECLNLPGCISEGETIDETLANMKEAIQGYIESLNRRGLPVPEESFGLY